MIIGRLSQRNLPKGKSEGSDGTFYTQDGKGYLSLINENRRAGIRALSVA